MDSIKFPIPWAIYQIILAKIKLQISQEIYQILKANIALVLIRIIKKIQ